jgi:hypothetical protein
VLAWDAVEPLLDADSRPVTRWDGRTTRLHSVTGEQVPDETARVPAERYINPRPTEWPEADFIVGNPPFIGNKRMRLALGDGYVDALRAAYPDVPNAVDYVMYWWDHAARLVRARKIERFGLITTNSITQTYSRQVVARHLSAPEPVSVVFAVPDHPWVDADLGAAVRISMSVVAPGERTGTVSTVVHEETSDEDTVLVVLHSVQGVINQSLRAGPDLGSAVPLVANSGLCWQGCKLVGEHFQITPEQYAGFTRDDPGAGEVLKRYLAGSDVTKLPRLRYVIDFFGLSADEARRDHPALFQHLLDWVWPERSENRDKMFREK